MLGMNEALFLEVIFVIFTENLSAMLSDIQGPPGTALRSHFRVHDSTTWVLLPANGEASLFLLPCPISCIIRRHSTTSRWQIWEAKTVKPTSNHHLTL